MLENSKTFDYEAVVPSQRSRFQASESVAATRPPRGWEARPEAAPSSEPSPSAPSLASPGVEIPKPVLKSGHALSYAGLFLFTTILFFRPYEIIPALSSFDRMAWWAAIFTLTVYLPTQFGLEGNLTARPREVNLVLLLCVAALLSMPLAMDIGTAWESFNQEFIKAVLMFIVLVNVVNTERRLKGLLLLTLAVSCYLGWNAVSDYGAGKFIDEFSRIWGSIGGMFGNPNDMALHLVTMLPIAVALLLSTRNFTGKLLYGMCAALITVAVVATFSRGGFVGLVAAGLVMAWKFGRRNRSGVLALAAVLLVLFVVLAPGSYASRVSSIFDAKLDATGSRSARSQLLERSIIVTIANPVFGIGMGNFPFVGLNNNVSHNAFTQVGAEMGFTAMLIYTLFIIAPLKRLQQVERETLDGPPESRRFYCLAIGLQASLVGYMASSFFVSVAYQFYVYYLVGYAVSLCRLYGARPVAAAGAPADGLTDRPLARPVITASRENHSRRSSGPSPAAQD